MLRIHGCVTVTRAAEMLGVGCFMALLFLWPNLWVHSAVASQLLVPVASFIPFLVLGGAYHLTRKVQQRSNRAGIRCGARK
jgi:hypothetical protein